jgi:hypothetical protein
MVVMEYALHLSALGTLFSAFMLSGVLNTLGFKNRDESLPLIWNNGCSPLAFASIRTYNPNLLTRDNSSP